MTFSYRVASLSFLLLLNSTAIFGQTPTVGLIQHNPGSLDDGYVLFAPIASTETYLIDKCGRKVHSWSSAYRPGQSVYLLPDGSLLRSANVNNTTFNAGGEGGKIEKMDWNGFVTWSYFISDSLQCQHHDIKPMPNGNILAIVWEKKSVDEAVAAGRNPSLMGGSVWSEKIIEIQPIGMDSAAIVWEWHIWDHLVQDYDAAKLNYDTVINHPELINLNFRATTDEDWIHMNSVDYNAELDQILLSNHNFNEIWVIDHSTSTAEAASHADGTAGKGGDLLWRWGNPFAYKYGTPANKQLFLQHSAYWIADSLPHGGDIMVFNNGNLRQPVEYSSVDIIEAQNDISGNYPTGIPMPPTNAYWIYTDSVPTNFYSKNISGAQQLSNGNVLICDGFNGVLFEVDSNQKTVWKYVNPVASYIYAQGSTNLVQTNVFRCTFYPTSYSGFSGHSLVAGLPIELNPYTDSCSLTTGVSSSVSIPSLHVFPNPASNFIHLDINAASEPFEVEVFDAFGKQLLWLQNERDFSVAHLNAGMYWIRVSNNRTTETSVFVKE